MPVPPPSEDDSSPKSEEIQSAQQPPSQPVEYYLVTLLTRQEFADTWGKVVDASTSTSTSSDWMGPPYGHRVMDPLEEFLGIFAVNFEADKLITGFREPRKWDVWTKFWHIME
jgi:hypothetical protein